MCAHPSHRLYMRTVSLVGLSRSLPLSVIDVSEISASSSPASLFGQQFAWDLTVRVSHGFGWRVACILTVRLYCSLTRMLIVYPVQSGSVLAARRIKRQQDSGEYLVSAISLFCPPCIGSKFQRPHGSDVTCLSLPKRNAAQPGDTRASRHQHQPLFLDIKQASTRGATSRTHTVSCSRAQPHSLALSAPWHI